LENEDLPFFKFLKRHDKFQWTEEVKQALENLKHHLHIISTPIVVEHQEEGHAFGV
jgi:hypothetical protein